MTQTVSVPGVGDLDFPDGMSQPDMAAAIQKNFPQIHASQPAAPSSNTAVAVNAANKGIAALPDMLLNAPTHVWNIVKSVPNMLRGELLPEQTPTPDFARRGAEAIGMIKPDIVPQGGFQKGLDLVTQGGVGGLLTGGASLPRAAIGAGMGALSAGATGATEAMGGSPAWAATAGLLPGGAAGARTLLMKPTAATKSQNYVKDETLANGRAAGYVVPPSAVEGGTFLGNRLEGIGGKAALNQEASLRNQTVTNKIARSEAGLSPNEPISEGTLEAARMRMIGPYQEVAALSPMAASALDKLKQTRADAKVYWNHYNRQADPQSLKQAQALDAKAQMYETVIDKIASSKGSPDLLGRLRNARMNLAKNYTIEDSINLGTGDVSAHVIGLKLDKGAPLTGGLETIGRFENAFGRYAREASKVQAPGVSKLEAMASLGLGTLGAATGAHYGMSPTEGFGAGAVLPLVAPSAARSLLLSQAMQIPRRYGPGTLADVTSRTAPIGTSMTLADLLRQQQQ